MKRTATLLTGMVWMGAMCLAAQAAGAPKIQFEKMVYDFGKTSQVETVSGFFKFKNIGDDVLKIEPPKPSCGCTLADLKPDTLKPGETGELPFTMHLGQAKAQFEKHIAVKSNDPVTPEVSLTIKADYTPLYELNPFTLAPKLEYGMEEAVLFTTITRNDGKPLQIARLDISKPWITATVEPGAKADAASAQIRVVIKRAGAPRRFNEYVHVYIAGQTDRPVSSIYVYGQVMGEVSVSPEALYWSVTDAAATKDVRPEAMVVRRVTIRSADGKGIEVKNPQSTIKGIKVELITKEPGKVYELVARLDGNPVTTLSGSLSVETSVASEPKIEVPFVINVFKQ